MKQLIKFLTIIVSLVISTSQIQAQVESSIAPFDRMPLVESHGYTYIVAEDGTAQAWIRIDGITPSIETQTYQYTLPDNSQGSAIAWYRENGCLEYTNDICSYYGSTNWKEIEVTNDGLALTLNIPPATYANRNYENSLTVGISFATNNVTSPSWWGRKVRIATGNSEQFVSYVSIGVYLPDGVYVRDHAQNPLNWGSGMREAMYSAQQAAPTVGADKASLAAMLDMAGGGQIYRYRQNLMPGQMYAFEFMSSQHLWQLFHQEIGYALMWLLAIGIVIAALLRLIVGNRPLSWYISLVSLLVLLGILLGGLWYTYVTAAGGPMDSPIMPMYKGDAAYSEPGFMPEQPSIDSLDVTDQVEPGLDSVDLTEPISE